MQSAVVAIVLNFRTPEKTLNCLRSLVLNGIGSIVLVDNSEDGGACASLLKDGVASEGFEGVSIDIIDDGVNYGFARGVNRALEACSRDDVRGFLLINSDAHMCAGALEALMTELDNGADIVAPLIYESESARGAPVRFYYQAVLGLILHEEWTGSFPFFTGACLLLSPRVVFPRLLDEDFFFYGEDVMLAFTAIENGWKSTLVDRCFVFHEGAVSARKGTLFYEYHINRGHWLLASKVNHGGVRKGVAFGARALMLPLRAVLRSVRFRSLTPITAAWIAFSDLLFGRLRTCTPQINASMGRKYFR